MAQYTLSLKKLLKPKSLIEKKGKGFLTPFKQNSKGQILIEGLIIIAFLLGFLILLQSLHLTAQKQIQQKRFSKKTEKSKASWVKGSGKEVKVENFN